MSRKRLLIGAGLAVAVLLIGFWSWSRGQCLSVRFEHGLSIPTCPDGDFRQRVQLEASELRRGAKGTVYVRADALYMVDGSETVQSERLSDFDAKLTLVGADGQETPVAPIDGWKEETYGLRGAVELPKVPDGEYQLRADVETSVGNKSVELPLPLYAPARIHVLTDRPLYEPGNTVKFRAVVLRANDLTPIDSRPGKWQVKDPDGNVLLEEQAPAGDWGVASGSFPLDSEAAKGLWSVSWVSGNDSGQLDFRVEPFTLPRFTVEASSQRPFYRAGETPVIEGSVGYSSGAPVANARIEVRWRAGEGAWPPPTEWLAGKLPSKATTDGSGRFSLTLPEVPADLRGKKTLQASIAAIDGTGDRQVGSAQVLLSEDKISVAAVTELGGGLVEGANNRVYLRVTTADGQPLPGAEIAVKKAWLPRDQPVTDELDADSVARLQLDPGPPVNVVVPPMPVRKSVRAQSEDAVVRLQGARDLLAETAVSLGDRAALERLNQALEPCADLVTKNRTRVQVVASVTAAGQITRALAGALPIDSCVAGSLRGKRLPAGNTRLLRLSYQLSDPGLPSARVSVSSELGDARFVSNLIADRLPGARSCLPRRSGRLARPMTFEVTRGSKRLQLSWVRGTDESQGVPASPALIQCLDGALRGLTLDSEADDSLLGVVRFTLDGGKREQRDRPERKPQPTIMRGYEMEVAVSRGDTDLGTTVLRLPPGQVPNFRVRANQVVAEPGDTIELAFLRGPDYQGDLPRRFTVGHRGKTETVKLEDEEAEPRYTLPDDARGWYQFRASGARALVFVESQDELEVEVAPDQPRYPPGADATLAVTTRIAGKGSPAAVGLFGVDATMAQLAPLPGPDAMNGLRPPVTMDEKVFGVLDGQALVSGRVRGKAAAEAVVLRVDTIPTPEEVDVAITDTAVSGIDDVAVLTSRFYDILAEVHVQTRAWESTAGEGQKLTPPQMAKLWKRSIEAVAKRGGEVEDAFGRRMRLHRLPDDLLALVDPRAVAGDATRLPEDVENWTRWVRRKRP